MSNSDRPQNIPAASNIQWIRLEAKRSRWWSYVVFPLRARRMGASAIHTQYSLSPLVGSVGFTTIHDVSFFIGPEWFSARDRLILQTSVPKAVRRAKGVFAVSETDKAEIEKYIPGSLSKTTVTFNACPSWVQPVSQDQARAELNSKLGIEGRYLLTVGTRWPRKNMELAIQAADALPDRFSQRLVVTGKSGWGDQSLGVRGAGVGYVPNELMSALYSAADLYLAPSRHEGFGIPLLEAFRCGCPVLCSTGGALPEVAGNAAEVERSWEPSHWSESIQSLLDDSSKLKRLREAGHRREREFSWEETARRTVNAYLGAHD